MKVQRIRLPENNQVSWLVLDDAYLPVQPICAFLNFLNNVGRSPYTIQASAYALKLFWEYLQDEQLDWTLVDVQQLAAFIPWLRRPRSPLLSTEEETPQRTNATIDQLLTAVHGFYEFHVRLQTVSHLALYQFLQYPNRRYKPLLYGIAKSKPIRSRVVKLKREQRVRKTLRREQVEQLVQACANVRDRFLLILLYETGLRIGQALGLRHEDLKPEENAICIVPRDHNSNGARAKTWCSYTVPVAPVVMQCYIDYLVQGLQALEAEALPDYVFVNLWEGEIGRPMTYGAVMSLCHRLQKKTGIHVTPHLLRHTRATEWLRDDHLPLATVSRLLGHTSIQTTHDTYVHLTPEDLRQDLKRRQTSKGDASCGS